MLYINMFLDIINVMEFKNGYDGFVAGIQLKLNLGRLVYWSTLKGVLSDCGQTSVTPFLLPVPFSFHPPFL